MNNFICSKEKSHFCDIAEIVPLLDEVFHNDLLLFKIEGYFSLIFANLGNNTIGASLKLASKLELGSETFFWTCCVVRLFHV